MTRIKKLGRITACADAWFWPFSRTARENEADGLEIEILDTIAKKYDWDYEIMWVNMKTRFGPGAPGGAYDRSINKGGCDIVLGLAISGDDHHMAPNELIFSKPFMSTGFVMVTQGSAKDIKTLDDAKRQNVKVGMPNDTYIENMQKKIVFHILLFFKITKLLMPWLQKKSTLL